MWVLEFLYKLSGQVFGGFVSVNCQGAVGHVVTFSYDHFCRMRQSQMEVALSLNLLCDAVSFDYDC